MAVEHVAKFFVIPQCLACRSSIRRRGVLLLWTGTRSSLLDVLTYGMIGAAFKSINPFGAGPGKKGIPSVKPVKKPSRR